MHIYIYTDIHMHIQKYGRNTYIDTVTELDLEVDMDTDMHIDIDTDIDTDKDIAIEK